MNRAQASRRLGLIVGIFLVLSLAHSLWLPLHKAPDEIAHFLYSRFIARTGHLPRDYQEREQAGYLSFWPPLYHFIVAGLTGWSDSAGPPYLKFVWESPRFEMAEELLDTKRLANTEDELPPYQGGVLMWHLGRVVSIVLSLGTIVVTFFTNLAIYPGRYRLAVVASAIIAFVPAFIFISSAMSYASLVGLLTGLYFWVLVRIVRGHSRLINYVWLGLLLGLSVTAKYTAVILPVEVVGVVTYLTWRERWGWWGWLQRIGLTAFVSILAASWWFWFLIANFNEIDELGPVVGTLKPIIAGGIDASQNYIAFVLTGGQIGTVESNEITSAPFSAWVWRIFHSFWARRIGDYPLAPSAYLFIGAVCALSIMSLVRVWRNQVKQRVWIALLVFHLLLFLVFPLLRFIIQGNINWTAQGRHVLFPVATVLPVLLIYGWRSWPGLKWERWLQLVLVAALGCWSLAQLVRITTYYPPLLPVRTTGEALTPVSRRVDKAVGDHLVLRGYNLQVMPTAAALQLNLYWQSPTYPDEDYRMQVSLNDGANSRLIWSAYPVNGRYATRVWESWETIRDDLWLPLVDLPPGRYQVYLQLYGAGGPLPIDGLDRFSLGEIELSRPLAITPARSFSLKIGEREVVSGFTLWQAQAYQRLGVPEYRPRMAIPLVWQGRPGENERVQWLLVDRNEQVHRAEQASAHVHYFIVGADWPSGPYRLRAELWRGQEIIGFRETGPILTVFNERPRRLEPPPLPFTLAANFADRVKLLGYDLPARAVPVGQGIPITLYWQGLRTMDKSYTVFTKLLDGTGRAWANAERLPADGYSTIHWWQNEVVIDSFELPVDPATPAGIYRLNVGLYEEIVEGKAVSLPLVRDGQSSRVTSVTFGPVKIGRTPPAFLVTDPQPDQPLSVELGGMIRLRGYDLSRTGRTLSLKLYWECLAPIEGDYTVFVHVQDQAGKTVAQMDQPPLAGAYPTSLWEAGEVIADSVQVTLPEISEPAGYTIVTGMYDFTNGARLTTSDGVADSITLLTIEYP